MMSPEVLQRSLCKAYCTGITVTPVPVGYAVSSPFSDRSGDRLGFYVVETADGLRIEDDGDYLATLIANGIDIDAGTRGKLLNAILTDGDAACDPHTYEISTKVFPENELMDRAIRFVSCLIRIRDLELLTRENVRSTFREDALNALQARLGDVANIDERQSIDEAFSDFPSDVVIRPKIEGRPAALYFVSANEHLLEADLLRSEARQKDRKDFSVIGLIEDLEIPTISKKKFQRAQNRGLVMPIFRGDEHAAIDRIFDTLEIKEVV